MPGIEYGDEDDVVHIPVWGRVPFFGDAPSISELLPQVREAGGTAVWAHPWRRDAWRRFDPSWCQNLDAMEVWNRKYDGFAPNRRSLDLSRRLDIPTFVSLDLHTGRQLFPLSIAIQLERSGRKQQRLPSNRPDQVYAALRAGNFSSRALGVALERLTGGPPAAVLRALESSRRVAAGLVH